MQSTVNLEPNNLNSYKKFLLSFAEKTQYYLIKDENQILRLFLGK